MSGLTNVIPLGWLSSCRGVGGRIVGSHSLGSVILPMASWRAISSFFFALPLFGVPAVDFVLLGVGGFILVVLLLTLRVEAIWRAVPSFFFPLLSFGVLRTDLMLLDVDSFVLVVLLLTLLVEESWRAVPSFFFPLLSFGVLLTDLMAEATSTSEREFSWTVRFHRATIVVLFVGLMLSIQCEKWCNLRRKCQRQNVNRSNYGANCRSSDTFR